MLHEVLRNAECREQCTTTNMWKAAPADYRVCPHGRFWEHIARINATRYWHRIPVLSHPIIYLRLRRKRR